MTVSVLKLVMLFFGFMGYFIGAQQPSEGVHSIANNNPNWDKRSIIYLNGRAPIIVGIPFKK